MGSWKAVWCRLKADTPLPYNYAVEFNSLAGDCHRLKLNGTECMFNHDDAKTVAAILNKQVEEATEYCINLIRKENELS